MPLVNFANLDFDQVRTSLKEYLRANSTFTDYDFEGSNLSSIIDLLAYNTYITSYNANMVSNEVFIDSATLRENVVSLARNIGNVPKSRKAAAATISVFVDCSNISPTPSTITLKAGPVAATSGSFGNKSFIFSICNDITVPILDGIANFDEIRQSINRYEPRVELIDVEVSPDFDNNSFDVLIVYDIIGADVPPQELQFALQSTR